MLGDEAQGHGLEAVRGAARAQLRCVAGAAGAEVEVLADDDHARLERFGEHLVAEARRRKRREPLVERQEHELLGPQLLDEADLLGQRRQQARRMRGVDDRQRVPVEGHHRAEETALGGQGDGLTDHGAVTHVDAVEGADRQGSRTGLEVRQIGDDPHQSLTSSLRAWPSSAGP